MAMIAYVMFNSRVLGNLSAPVAGVQVGWSFEEWLRFLDTLPPVTYDSRMRAQVPDDLQRQVAAEARKAAAERQRPAARKVQPAIDLTA